MANENRDACLEAIWGNPERVFGGQWKQSRNKWEYLTGGEWHRRGAVTLLRKPDGIGITVSFNHGSGRGGIYTDVIDYLRYDALNTGGFNETLQRLAELYGITLQFSQEERQTMARTALAREVTASLVEALRRNPDGVTGRYLRDVRGIEPDGTHFGELTKESIAAAQESLRRRGLKYDVEDFKALGLTEFYADLGYNCVIPYYVNGSVRGFVLRNTRPNCEPKDRYRYSQGLGRGGYCDALTHGEPAVIVEGQFDAVRLIQAGVPNVIAVGGAKIGEDIARLLKAHGITQITYVPDLEYNEQGKRKRDIVTAAIKAFQSAQVDGVPVVDALYIAELPTPDGVNLNGLKIDADSYGREHGGEALADVVQDNTAAWAWELDALIDWAKAQEQERGQVNVAGFRKRFTDIYTRCNPYERQVLRDEIDGNPIYKAFGVTPQALRDVDELQRDTEANNRTKDGAAALNKALQEGASPERIRAIVRELNDAVTLNTRDEWNAQLNTPFAEELKAIEEQPDTLKTKWEVGTVNKEGKYFKHDNIEFYPADIEVFCAPTSHGKTMILFQSVMDLIATTDKTYLYVSCEENKRQLLERALNVYIDVPTTENGQDANGGYCFKAQTRKKTIKAVIRGDVPPYEYADFMGRSEHYDALSKQIRERIRRYETDVFPRLKLIHTEAAIESICANIARSVEELRGRGVDVGGVFVDYMQLLTTDARNYSRHDELKDICKALKDCAARTELPIVIAAQLNREVLKQGIDSITVANIGEGADIERIAHDIYLVWQIDKTQESLYTQTDGEGNATINPRNLNVRSSRIFTRGGMGRNERELKKGFIYIERMKARDGKTEGWGLLPYDGERGYIGENDTARMTE